MKLKKYFKIVNIDSFFYVFTKDKLKTPAVLHKLDDRNINIKIDNKKKCISYLLYYGEQLIHRSNIYKKLHITKLITPEDIIVIGDCNTSVSFRGKSVYPFIINKIAKDFIKEGYNKVFILVNVNNIPSIRGIEKANFTKYCHIQAKRIGFLYIDKKIKYY